MLRLNNWEERKEISLYKRKKKLKDLKDIKTFAYRNQIRNKQKVQKRIRELARKEKVTEVN